MRWLLCDGALARALGGTAGGFPVGRTGSVWPWLPAQPAASAAPSDLTGFRFAGQTLQFSRPLGAVLFRDQTPQLAAQVEVD